MVFYPVPARPHQFSIVNMDHSDRFTVGNVNYIPVGSDDHGYRFRNDADARHEVHMSYEDIYAKLVSRAASIEYNYNSKSEQLLRLVYGDQEFDDFSDKRRSIATLREKLIQKYDEACLANGKAIPRSDAKLQDLLDAWWAEIVNPKTDESGRRRRSDQIGTMIPAPSVRTFNRFYKHFRQCGQKSIALIHRHHGPGMRLYNICPASIAFARTEAMEYMSRLKPTKAHVYLQYCAKLTEVNETRQTAGKMLLHKVSRKKFESMIDRFDKFEVDAGRHGEKWAIDHYSRNLRKFDILGPGEQVESDEWNVDLTTLLAETGIWAMLPDAFREKIPAERIWMVAAVDVATHYVLGFKASTNPKAVAATAAIRMVMTDKTHISTYVGARTPWIGFVKPKKVYSDHGSAFIAEHTRRILVGARIDVTRPPAGRPHRRPFIESLFHSIGPLITAYFDGRTFGSVAEKGDYDPEAHVSLTVDEFIKMFTFAICDIYHNKPHSGLGGNTPHNAWVQGCRDYPIDFPPSAEGMLHIFGTRMTRKISKYGITVMGIDFSSDELNAERMRSGQADFQIKVDPENMRRIAVKGHLGWFTVENVIGLDDTISLEEWGAARLDCRNSNAAAAETGLAAMYAAINRLRASGEAATFRAGLSPRIPTADDYTSWEREFFGAWRAGLGEAPLLDPVVVKAPDDILLNDRFTRTSAGLGSVGADNRLAVTTTATAETVSKFDLSDED